MHRLDWQEGLQRPVVAFVEVPAWICGARKDLQERLEMSQEFDTPLPMPFLTHNLCDPANDPMCNALRHFDKANRREERVKVIFVPCYLDGQDGVFNQSYYELLIAADLTIYPSYYEPWGYTPLESVAFHVPTLTTSLSGFGMWANEQGCKGIEDGVAVIPRNDYNYAEVADGIVKTVLDFAQLNKSQVDAARRNAAAAAEKALWRNFISYYYEAYDIALQNKEIRNTDL